MSKISVIIPAHNAEATLPRTLRSVMEQTHRDLEILVIDDGSQDDTPGLAERMRLLDGRVRVFRQSNAGVAGARNAGIENTTGEFIAPLDADDIWHPRKLELQLDRFERGDERLGLVYNWFRAIDREDRVVGTSASPRVEGMCLHRHLGYNFISNGSTPLIRRTALGELRYNTDLAKADAGGCEDYLLQMQIAREWEFALVPAWLTGYRKAGMGMSSDVARMIRSHIAAFLIMRGILGPSSNGVISRRLARLQVEYVRNRLKRGKFDEARAAFFAATREDALRLPRDVAEEAVAAYRGLFARPVRDSFNAFEPDRPDGEWTYKLGSFMAGLKLLDDRIALAAERMIGTRPAHAASPVS